MRPTWTPGHGLVQGVYRNGGRERGSGARCLVVKPLLCVGGGGVLSCGLWRAWCAFPGANEAEHCVAGRQQQQVHHH